MKGRCGQPAWPGHRSGRRCTVLAVPAGEYKPWQFRAAGNTGSRVLPSRVTHRTAHHSQPVGPEAQDKAREPLALSLESPPPNQGCRPRPSDGHTWSLSPHPQTSLGPSPRCRLGPEPTSDPDTLCALLHARPTSLWATPMPVALSRVVRKEWAP